MKIFRYIFLVSLGVALITRVIPFGDYCTGLWNGLFAFLIGGLMFLAVTIFGLIDIFKTKTKVDLIPLLILVIIGITYTNYCSLKNKKFWTSILLKAEVENAENWKGGVLYLYKNGSFAVTTFDVEINCTYQGCYTLNGDTLKLQKQDLELLTNSVFNNHYYLNRPENLIIPISNNASQCDNLSIL